MVGETAPRPSGEIRCDRRRGEFDPFIRTERCELLDRRPPVDNANAHCRKQARVVERIRKRPGVVGLIGVLVVVRSCCRRGPACARIALRTEAVREASRSWEI